MELTNLTLEQIDAAYIELVLARSSLVSRAFGELEQYYLDRADLLTPVIDALSLAGKAARGCSDAI